MNKAKFTRSRHFEFSNKVQCQHCHKYISSGHVHCSCGRSLVFVDTDPVIVEQIQRNVRQKFEVQYLHPFPLKDQLDSGVSRKNNRKEEQHNWLFTSQEEKVTHRFSIDGLEMTGTENFHSVLDGPKKK